MGSKPAPAGHSETSPRAERLAAFGFDITVVPSRGGRIDVARFQGHDLLVPRSDLTAELPLDAGSFPLVPFSNRIRGGAFTHGGQVYDIGANWTGDAHAIHGEGWQQPWLLTSKTPTSLSMQMEGTEWWPWSYECEQTIQLTETRLEMSLSLLNTDIFPMPAGLGFHPYFCRTEATQLTFSASAVWPPLEETGSGPLPLASVRDFSAGDSLGETMIDHCYEGWEGPALIRQPDGPLDIRIETGASIGDCTLFAPPGRDFFCFEPVSHLTGAFEHADKQRSGLVIVEPGQRFDFSMTITPLPVR